MRFGTDSDGVTPVTSGTVTVDPLHPETGEFRTVINYDNYSDKGRTFPDEKLERIWEEKINGRTSIKTKQETREKKVESTTRCLKREDPRKED